MTSIYTPELLLTLAVLSLITGAISGVLAGLLGVGGGIVIVPVLFLLFEYLDIPASIAMHLAVATSLATIVPTSISSARSHYKKGSIDIDLFKSWSPFIFVGAAVGGLLSKAFDSSTLSAIFGCVALLVSINMVLPKQIVLSQNPPKSTPMRGATGLSIGGFSALMGIGGGTLSVPLLSMMSFPVHRAIGTASAFGLMIAVPAVLGFIWSGWGVPDRPPYSLGYVSIPPAVMIFSASIFTAPQGAKLAHWLKPKPLRLAFAIFLFASAVKMISSVI